MSGARGFMPPRLCQALGRPIPAATCHERLRRSGEEPLLCREACQFRNEGLRPVHPGEDLQATVAAGPLLYATRDGERCCPDCKAEGVYSRLLTRAKRCRKHYHEWRRQALKRGDINVWRGPRAPKKAEGRTFRSTKPKGGK